MSGTLAKGRGADCAVPQLPRKFLPVSPVFKGNRKPLLISHVHMLGSGPRGNQCQVGVSPCPHPGIFSLGPLGCFRRKCLSSHCVKVERRDEQALLISILGTGSWVKCLPNKASPTCSTQLVGQCQGGPECPGTQYTKDDTMSSI